MTTLLEAALALNRETRWRIVSQTNLAFDVRHPQGMVVHDGTCWVSSMDVRVGKGHLFHTTLDGGLLDDIILGDEVCNHPGGFDFDGEAFWLPVAELRPRSRTQVWRVESGTLHAEQVTGIAGHVSTLTRDRETGGLIGCDWGSRTWYRWSVEGQQLAAERNPSHFIDYQDCQFIEPGHVLATGVAQVDSDRGLLELGGIGVMEAASLKWLHQVPFPHYTPRHVGTFNPSWFEMVDGELRLHTLPDGGGERLTVYGTRV